jgi:DNA-directed RNA polymerase alpha subunit
MSNSERDPWGEWTLEELGIEYYTTTTAITPAKLTREVGLQSTFQEQLEAFIESMPDSMTGEAAPYWVNIRRKDFEKRGEEALRTLINEDIRKDTKFLSRFFNNLQKCGICTRSELLDATEDDLKSIRGFGDKSLSFAQILQGVIREKREISID